MIQLSGTSGAYTVWSNKKKPDFDTETFTDPQEAFKFAYAMSVVWDDAIRMDRHLQPPFSEFIAEQLELDRSKMGL